MRYTNLKHAFDVLKAAVREEKLTPARMVEQDTLLLLTGIDTRTNTMGYYQVLFAELPEEQKPRFIDKKIGDSVDQIKIMGVYDVWGDWPYRGTT